MDYNYATEYEQAMEQIRELESELAELQESLEESLHWKKTIRFLLKNWKKCKLFLRMKLFMVRTD